MKVFPKLLGIESLSVAERMALVQEIWACIASEPEKFPKSDNQRTELLFRDTEDEATPNDVVAAEDVFSLARTRLAQRR
jgi:putative addiction module component (TIGR02574 family)